LETVNFNNKCI